MFDINGWEFIVLIVLGIVILGPERLPEYAAKLARLVKQLRAMADGARVQLREQLGPEFEDVNWRQYDPRQYDPRKIVRDALREPLEQAWNPVAQELTSVRESAKGIGASGAGSPDRDGGAAGDGPQPTPFDTDAT